MIWLSPCRTLTNSIFFLFLQAYYRWQYTLNPPLQDHQASGYFPPLSSIQPNLRSKPLTCGHGEKHYYSFYYGTLRQSFRWGEKWKVCCLLNCNEKGCDPWVLICLDVLYGGRREGIPRSVFVIHPAFFHYSICSYLPMWIPLSLSVIRVIK